MAARNDDIQSTRRWVSRSNRTRRSEADLDLPLNAAFVAGAVAATGRLVNASSEP
jgi:hypothetical protein